MAKRENEENILLHPPEIILLENHSIMIDKKLVISEYLSAYQKAFTSIKEQCEKYKDNFSEK